MSLTSITSTIDACVGVGVAEGRLRREGDRFLAVFAIFGGKPHAVQEQRLNGSPNQLEEKRELIHRRLLYPLFHSGRVAKTQHCEDVGYGDVDRMKRRRLLLTGWRSVN
jgi:hypothetical protein